MYADLYVQFLCLLLFLLQKFHLLDVINDRKQRKSKYGVADIFAE